VHAVAAPALLEVRLREPLSCCARLLHNAALGVHLHDFVSQLPHGPLVVAGIALAHAEWRVTETTWWDLLTAIGLGERGGGSR
jgi:hypothetical protein